MAKDRTYEITKRYVESYYKLFGERRVRTKKEFCELTGTFSSNFNRMEAGERDVSLTTIVMLIETYGISTDWVLFGKGDFYKK